MREFSGSAVVASRAKCSQKNKAAPGKQIHKLAVCREGVNSGMARIYKPDLAGTARVEGGHLVIEIPVSKVERYARYLIDHVFPDDEMHYELTSPGLFVDYVVRFINREIANGESDTELQEYVRHAIACSIEGAGEVGGCGVLHKAEDHQ